MGIRRRRLCVVCLLGLLFCLTGIAEAQKTYVVKRGDTLAAIARRYGMKAGDLASYNRLRNPNALTIGQVIKVPATVPQNKTYVVKRGDTVSGIATRFGVRSEDIIRASNLRRPDRLSIGQVLTIPGVSGTTTGVTASTRPQLPTGLKTSLTRQRVTTGKWSYIVIHHTATDRGSAAGIDRYHREQRRMANGMAYHFLIGNGKGMVDGEIAIGNRWKRQIKGGHVASESMNQKAIGICLVGNFEASRPTKKQMASLKALVDYLMKRCSIPRTSVQKHQEINTKPTICPGKNFDLSAVWQ